MVRIIVLIVGVALIAYVASTPGNQILAAALGGACIGTTIGLILLVGLL